METGWLGQSAGLHLYMSTRTQMQMNMRYTNASNQHPPGTDVIKTGGEWISTLDLENVAMSHPQVRLCLYVDIYVFVCVHARDVLCRVAYVPIPQHTTGGDGRRHWRGGPQVGRAAAAGGGQEGGCVHPCPWEGSCVYVEMMIESTRG